MCIYLDDEDSIQYLQGGWESTAVERYVEDDLYMKGVTEPVIVLLCDGTVAFYVAQGRTLD